MARPSSALTQTRPEIAASMMEYDVAADQAGYIGLQVAPVFEVSQAAGQFGIIPIEEMLQSPETSRGDRGHYNRGTWTFEPATYACKEHGWEEPVDDREAQIYRDYFDAEVVSAERARAMVLRAQEIRIAGKLFDSGTYTPTGAGTAWTDPDSKPISDIDALATAFWQAFGVWPNALVINKIMFRALRQNNQIADKVKSVERVLPGDIGVSHLQQAFDLPYIFVAGGSKNTANPAQVLAVSSIWSSDLAGLLRVPASRDLREPATLRTFHFGADGSTIGGAIETYRDEAARADIVRCRMDTDEKIVLPLIKLLDTTAA